MSRLLSWNKKWQQVGIYLTVEQFYASLQET